jgi:PhnO protein
MNVSIRKADEQDADAIYALVCELENMKFPKAKFVDLFMTNIKDEQIGYFVVLIDERIVGFGSIYLNKLLHHCGIVAEIQELIITEAYREKKIGSRLLSEIIKWSEQQGVHQIEVCCNNLRIKAHSFYKSNDFVLTHQKFVFKTQ